ncbi:MAG: bifunctional chorismate mutase/prephenate dehydratase [Oscillospiraceae bacterium]|nr:bifunctional chorismate mutase/prephenate dehydratase [Oscillospiraceae bacterium]
MCIINEFPKTAVVACQGTEGAYSQSACKKLFEQPIIMYFDSFDAVFNAVDKGMCKYGILPLENSLHGSVTEVYDLMRRYSFSIARTAKVKINHALLANHGSFAPQIKEIYSHEQALSQCSDFIKNLQNIKITSCANTAVAARTVSESGRNDFAAIANPNCADLYELSIISLDIQNNSNNYTRFICISKETEIYPEADKVSLMFTVAHKPGSLYEFLGKFANIGVNLSKLESRPIPGSDFEFMFYAEMDADANSAEIARLFKQLYDAPEYFTFLGNYSEI